MIHQLIRAAPRVAARAVVAGDATGCGRCAGRGLRLADPRRSDGDMVEAFRAHGGLLGGDELAGMLRSLRPQPVSWIARLIVSRRIVTVDVHSHLMIPMFQFDGLGLAIRASATRVFDELVDVYDDAELARWFAQPNDWLAHASPLETLEDDPDAVVAAARADRFVARG